MARTILLFLLLTGVIITGHAQFLEDKQGNTVAPYYIDFNSTEKTSVMEVRGEYLHIQYNDAIGESAAIPFAVYNWKGEAIKQLTLNKTFGLNYFDIKFEEHGFALTENESYTCRLTDEKGKKYEVYVRYLPPVKMDITANIFVKPILLLCDDPSGGNLTEFFGEIGGGKAPYIVNWYVMNKHRTEFLYQPKRLVILRPDETSSIQVDKSPEYYVMLYVKDACGNEQTATVQVTCEGNKKKINTVFFDLIQTPAGKGLKN